MDPGQRAGRRHPQREVSSRSFSAPRTPTMQPIRLMTRLGFFFLSGASEVTRPIGFVFSRLADDTGI
jgi:hypothetical protein